MKGTTTKFDLIFYKKPFYNMTGNPLPAIEMRNLSKRYGNNQVLRSIDLCIQPGQIIGYIGPNGAGKSTTVRILAGLDGDYEGEAIVAGVDVKNDPLAVKKMIGYVPEVSELYDTLTPLEFLDFVGSLHEMPGKVIAERSRKMLNFFGLSPNLNDRMDTFSKGMRQKVLLVSGLMHNPKILFLDEPLSGLDANSVILVKELLNRLAAEGKTVFYCSHMMDVVEKISNRIVLLHKGTVFAEGRFDELKERYGDTLENIFSKLTGSTDFSTKASEFLTSFED